MTSTGHSGLTNSSKRQTAGTISVIMSSETPARSSEDGSGPASSGCTSTVCPVCSGDLSEPNLMITMKELETSAARETCAGCSFLWRLSQTLHLCIHRRPLTSEQNVMVNWGLAYPPTEFLLLPDRNVYSQDGKIEVFRTPTQGSRCPWPTIKEATVTSGRTGSEACLKRVGEWLLECLSSHKGCKLSNFLLPTRVLDLGEPLGSGTGTIAIPVTINLSEGISEAGVGTPETAYACLSHRWIEGDTPTTTATNLAEHKQGIKFDTLPRRYQDAIIFTTGLGIRYIWIDSLCILQEDNVDWLREAPRMAEYYSNAMFTLSASTAVLKNQGLFVKDDSPTLTFGVKHSGDSAKVAFDINNIGDSTSNTNYSISCRLPLSHKEGPLHQRGWVYQEHMLSQRVIHFLEREVVFECRESTRCECSRILDGCAGTVNFEPISTSASYSFVYQRKSRYQKAIAIRVSPQELKNVWMEIVHEYSQQKLTFESDILPALAGLAKEMQNRRGCRYYAGLWEDSLIEDLLWEAEDEGYYPVGHQYPKPLVWRAPSWSWASSTACINWTHVPFDPTNGEFIDYNLIDEVFIRDLEAECTTLGGDAFMGLETAKLTLTGDLNLLSTFHAELSSQTGYRGFSLDHKMMAEEIVVPSLLRLLTVVHLNHGRGKFIGLVLAPVGEQPHHYKRIGLLHHEERGVIVERGVRITIL